MGWTSIRAVLRRRGVRDGLIAAVLFGLVCVESTAAGRFPGPTWSWLLTAVAGVASLAWRRRWPVAVLAVGCVAIVVEALAVGVPQSAGFFLASLLATYTVAAHSSARGRSFAAVVLMITLPAYLSQDPKSASLTSALPTLFIQAAAWTAGSVVRRRGEQATAAAAAARHAEEESVRAAADERIKIAHELHDVVAHALSVMVVQSSTARVAYDRGDPLAREAIAAVEATGRDALTEMRRILDVLRPSDDGASVAPLPSLADLHETAVRLQPTGVRLATDLSTEALALPSAVQLSLYRIAQEALTNVVKHAGPTTARLAVRLDDETVVLTVDDDGGTAIPEQPLASGGRGQVNMRERAAAFGGAIQSGPRPGGGYGIRATLPLRPQPVEPV
jgi:signal transduction histidine kinase